MPNTLSLVGIGEQKEVVMSTTSRVNEVTPQEGCCAGALKAEIKQTSEETESGDEHQGSGAASLSPGPCCCGQRGSRQSIWRNLFRYIVR